MYHLTVESLKDFALFTLDPQGCVTTWNAGAQRLTGYSAEEIIGKHCSILYASEDSAAGKAQHELEEAARGVRSEVEGWRVRNAGGKFWASTVTSALRDAAGKLEGFAQILRDMTELRKTQEALRASEAHLKLAMEAAHLGTWERNCRTGRDFWSEQEERLFGLAPGTFEGTHEAFLKLVEPEDRPKLAEAVRRALDNHGVYHSEFRIRWPDDSIHWMAGLGDTIWGADGQPERMVGVTMDITQRKLAEAERDELLPREQRARAQAEAALRVKDNFLAILSHELRTPLTPVLCKVLLLKRRPGLPPELLQDLEMIRRNVELETRLIGDLTDIAALSHGQLRLRLETVDAHESIQHALAVYQAVISAKMQRVTLELNARRHHVLADPVRLQQVFWNLIGNAVKYTPESGVITIASSNDGDGGIKVVVQDSGVGISPEFMPLLFDAFSQGEDYLRRRFGGLGLGLSISKSLLELQGGTIAASSGGRDQGSAFTVRMPTVEAPTPARRPAAPVVAPAPTRSLRLLLVEDNEDTVRVFGRWLRLQGHSVDVATSVAEALGLDEREKYDLLISDIGLPDGTGWQLMETVLQRHAMKAIAVSGFVSESDIQHSKASGFAAHLAKPFRPQELEALIEQVSAPAG